ncbi:hypothetical protein AB0C77_30110 [Streptomyces sp. NPDC048629]|uniref:hypothetical protein n=1 Tax=Streptomyces sp. NPDC048629 TaxID=3154824 RepID=UPI0034145CE8
MALSGALTALMAERGFWPVYLFEDEGGGDDDGDVEASARGSLGCGGGYELVLDVDLGAESVELGLSVPGAAEPVELGWDDRAHFHPHVMRWTELDLLARAFALHDPETRHPGPVLALLARFVVLDESDALDVVVPYLDAAFGLVRPRKGRGVRPETRDWFEAHDPRGTGLAWIPGPDGVPALAEQGESGTAAPYTLRAPDSMAFPFAAWSALLAEAEEHVAAAVRHPALSDPAVREALQRAASRRGHSALGPLAEALRAAGYAQPVLLRALTEPASRAEACWAVETLAGLPYGTVAKRWFGRSPLTEARSWDLALRITTPDPVVDLAEALDGALRKAGLGRTEIAGGGSDHTVLDVLVRDDLDRAAVLVAEALDEHGLTAAAHLHHASAPHEPVPLPSP